MKMFLKLIMYVAISLVVLIGGCFVAGQIMIRIPQTHITKHPMALGEFVQEFGVTNLPSSASNICYATSSLSMGFAGARLYRFDAPLVDCLAHAQQLIARSNNGSDGDEQVSTQLIAISSSPQPIQRNILEAYGLRSVDWYDVDQVKNGVEGKGPPCGLSLFWVDTDRQRFYYYWTD